MQKRPAHPLILSIDTATGQRSVALYRGDEPLALRTCGADRGPSAHLLEEIDEILRGARSKLREIDLFAAACGPGSFTGLRAGLATVKAFAAMLERAAIGVPTLHAVALAAGPAPKICAVLPAGRGEVFAQFLTVADDGAIIEHGGASHLTPRSLAERAAGIGVSLNWAGEGAWAQRETLREFAGLADAAWREVVSDDARFEGEREIVWRLMPKAESYAGEVARLASRAYASGAEMSVETVRALYVRLSDAEIKEQCRV